MIGNEQIRWDQSNATNKGKVINRAMKNGQYVAINFPGGGRRVVFQCFHCKNWITEEAVEADHYPNPSDPNLPNNDDISRLVLACRPCNAANIQNTQQMKTRGQLKLAGDNRKYTEVQVAGQRVG
ncbi:HNH endonuclease signature motif containing protein [Musicola paradisiaca]|uniref:HNH endonuclease n=1 Tax=Musicola paradisiaca (strain Ech703) TaxID=579405 RepID=C6C3J2_MUSP7|nr:HNH endonuclease signature motif containing protein [Musicola paradisiaca]ACS87290.1 hypothetical protein Dd703_3531 [Musicola paradisiaca Ech703]